jgi:hypothetical protein
MVGTFSMSSRAGKAWDSEWFSSAQKVSLSATLLESSRKSKTATGSWIGEVWALFRLTPPPFQHSTNFFWGAANLIGIERQP